MADFSYNPGVTPNAAAYTYQGLNSLGDALGQGIGSFLQNQRKHAEEVAANQAQDAKNQVLYNHLSQLPPSPITGRPYLTQDDMLAFQKGSLAQRQKIMEAAAANAATDTALQNQQFINQGRQANTGFDVARTGLITNPPRMQPVQGAPPGTAVTSGGGITPTLSQPAAPLMQVPVWDSTTGQPTGRTAVTGGNLPHTVLNDAPFKPSIEPITGPNNTQVNIFHKAPGQFEVYDPQGNRLELTDEEKKAYTDTGKIPLRTSAKSFVPESMVGQPTDAVKGFDETIGKRYGLKSADLYKIDFTTPNSIKFFDKSGQQLSTDQAAQAKPNNVDAVIPVAGEMGMVNRTMPLGDWNTIVNAWNQLPRAGQMVQPQTTAAPAAPTNAATSTDPLIQVTSPSGVPGYVPKSKLDDALKAGYKQQ